MWKHTWWGWWDEANETSAALLRACVTTPYLSRFSGVKCANDSHKTIWISFFLKTRTIEEQSMSHLKMLLCQVVNMPFQMGFFVVVALFFKMLFSIYDIFKGYDIFNRIHREILQPIEIHSNRYWIPIIRPLWTAHGDCRDSLCLFRLINERFLKHLITELFLSVTS